MAIHHVQAEMRSTSCNNYRKASALFHRWEDVGYILAMQVRSLMALSSTFYRTLQQALFVRAITTAFVLADKARKKL